MNQIISYKDAENIKRKSKTIFIDVRSPKEYSLETIPGSINIPLLNNKEREIVGTAYRKESSDKAKKLGVEFVSKKLPIIYEEISSLNNKYDNLIFFCARGGYRSSSIVSVLNSIGVKTIKLEGGYKGYRKHIMEELPNMVNDIDFIVLYGNTGTGKTKILKYLRREGMNVVDLEGDANHRGSTLGGVGLGDQTSQKEFESLIYNDLKARNNNLVFIEGESRRIGKDVVPEYLFNRMKEGIHVNIEADLDYRVQTILNDYVHGTDDELINSLNYLRQHLGNSKIDTYISLIKKKNYAKVIEELMINYYDPLYENNTRNIIKNFHNSDHLTTAKKIIKWANKY